VRLKWKSKASI